MADEDVKTTETEEQHGDDSQKSTEGDNANVDSDKTVEKLQKRLGKETAEKKDLQAQLDDVSEKLKQLQEGKDVKQLSDEEKANQADKAKDNKIAELQTKLKLTESKVQTNDVLKEAGLTVSSEMLDLIVSPDDKQTLVHVKALTDFANNIRENTRKDFMKGNPPHDGGDTKKTTSLDGMSLVEQSKLLNDDPELYKRLSQQ